MVEHIWIRLAELREVAANEEWDSRNPRLARWRRSLRFWHVRCKLLCKWLREQETAQKVTANLRERRQRMEHSAVLCHLLLTRCGCQPLRILVSRLSTKELKEEMAARGLDDSDCIEREDLLDVLCGPRPADASETHASDAPATLDKMV